MQKIRVLIVDDSFVIRRVVSEELAKAEDIEVVGAAANGKIAVDRAAELNPDLVILDIEMPEMDGLTALTHLRRSHPKTPVIMFSSLTELGAAATLDALTRGASDFFAKPKGSGGLEDARLLIRTELLSSIRALCARKSGAIAPTAPPFAKTDSSAPAARCTPSARSPIDLVAIGASTGGPNALAELFSALPAALPVPIVVVQHMPPMFTQLLAERLSKQSGIPTVEAKSGMELAPGRAWIAPGDFHMVLERVDSRFVTKVQQDPPENACRPAFDPLLRSVAQVCGPRCLAVVLTGMGQDGLRGCEAVRRAGGQIVVQDEATSVVWGMPGFVARAGLADRTLPLPLIADEIVKRASHGRG